MKEEDKHWYTLSKVYRCPECGWVTECYPNCPIDIATKEQ